MTISALDPTDLRQAQIAVAGPAALLVAKLHKLGERKDDPGRLVDKDAHDIYRSLIATDTAEVGARLTALASDQLAGPATTVAITHLRELFADATSLGSIMAGRAEQLVGDPEVVSASVAALASDLLDSVDQDQQ